jgi:microcystin degradation protein MlrC
MPRILIAGLAQEVSSFNPVETEFDLFAIHRDIEIITANRGTSTAIAGALNVFDDVGECEIVPTYSARAVSAGPQSAACWNRLSEEFLESLAPFIGNVDAIYLSLHGAMDAKTESDPEGFILEKIREMYGHTIPVVFSLDLHGILTEKMTRLGDGITAYHTYPHVDLFDTGERAAKLLLKILAGSDPVTARVRVPALVRGDELITDQGCFGDQINEIKRLEANGEILAGGFMIGNPFTDVPELCSQVFITTDGDSELASQAALRLASQFWANRKRMQSNLIPLAEAVNRASEMSGPIAFTDAADAPSSGSPGDSNAIVAEMIRSGYQHSVLAPLTDPSAAKKAFEVGVGGRFTASLGGALDPRFEPISLEVEVKLLSDGKYILESWGTQEDSGPTAVLTSDNYTLVVCSKPVRLFDRSLFLGHGQDPKYFHSTIVKSPHCQPWIYDEWVEHNFNVDAPGSTSANLRSLGHTVCQRPMFPLEEDAEFEPKVEIAHRSR